MTRRFLTHFSTVFFVHLALVFGGLGLVASQANNHRLGNQILNLKIAGQMLMAGSPSVSAPSRPKVSRRSKSSQTLPSVPVAPVATSQSSEIGTGDGKPGTIPGYGGGSLSGTAMADLKTIYKAELRQRIDQNKFYPLAARRLGQTGIVIVAFTLQIDGSIMNVRIDRSSGNSRLDTAGIEAVNKVGKFKAIPSEFGPGPMDMSVPIKFQTI